MNMMEICSSMALEWLSKLHVDQCEQRIWGGGGGGCYTVTQISAGISQKGKNKSDIQSCNRKSEGKKIDTKLFSQSSVHTVLFIACRADSYCV